MAGQARLANLETPKAALEAGAGRLVSARVLPRLSPELGLGQELERSEGKLVGKRTAGDLIFEAYLAERGFEVPEHEPDLGIGSRPDYVVERDGARCVIEVKSFGRDAWPIRRGTTSMQTVLKPIRGQIHNAARQLRDAERLGLPLVVVLTDPLGSMGGLLRPFELIAAMHGDPMVHLQTTGHETVGPATVVAGRNGELRNDHPYVSAVVVIHKQFDETHRSQVYLTHARGAKPLPPMFFARESDEVYEYSDQTDQYGPHEPPSQ